MTAALRPDALRLGTLLPTRELSLCGDHDPLRVVGLAERLEAEGVDSLWIGESVVARPRLDTYTMLAAVAARTARATIGTAVMLPSLRNPVAFAHQVATLDRLARGRLVLGVGAGFPGDATRAEFACLGADYARRVGGVEATLEAARALWRSEHDPASDPTGRFGFEGVRLTPPPVEPNGPPTWLATATPAGLGRCGRAHDGWLPYPTDPEQYRLGLETVRKEAEAAGRDPRGIAAGLYVTVAVGEGGEADALLEAYATRYYGLPSRLVGAVQAMVAGSLEVVAERIAAYVAAGARHIVIRHARFDVEAVGREAVALHAAIRRVADPPSSS